MDHGSQFVRQAAAFYQAGQFAQALTVYERMLAAAPRDASLHYGRALSLWALGRKSEAVAGYDAAISLQPEMVEAHFNRAVTLQQLKQPLQALAGYDAVLALRPALARAWNNRAGVLQELERYPEALDSLDMVLSLAAGDASAHYNRGTVLLLLRRYEEAGAALEKAFAINPAHPMVAGSLLTAAIKACDWERLETLAPRVLEGAAAGRLVLTPLTALLISDDPAMHRLCAQANLAAELAKTNAANLPALPRAAHTHQRMRLGYMSSDFKSHPVGIQLVDLLECHDRQRFEVVGIFTGRDDGSALHRRIAAACDDFIYAAHWDDAALAKKIQELQIDVLIDLNGQTDGWRPGVLRQRPAPVQVAWLGFAGTTGATYMDYIIADAVTAPEHDAPHFTEEVVRLPHSFWPAARPVRLRETMTRAQAGLPATGFVFCCFNNHGKITSRTFDVWMRILSRTPDGVLWLRDGPRPLVERLRREVKRRGVDPARLLFAAGMDSREQHLQRQGLADIFLDTAPYGAHATAADALVAGVPVLTVRGGSFVSRVAASMLSAAGLPELVAPSLDAYEALAIALARDGGRLAGMRRTLREAASPFFDPDKFRSDMETALIAMYQKTASPR